MDHAAFTFVGDLDDDPGLLDRLRGAGVSGLVLAVAYHQARDVAPRNPGGLVQRHDGLYFTPPQTGPDGDELFGSGSLRPPQATTVPPTRSDAVEACRRAAAVGLEVDAWTVCAHSSAVGLANLDLTQENCLGGRVSPADLCPTQPRVQRYLADLAVTAGMLGVRSVLLESAHFGSFGHGYHHERSFVLLGEFDQYLLGLCWCAACVDRFDREGLDSTGMRAVAAGRIRDVLAGRLRSADAPPLSIAGLGQLHPGLADMVRVRCDIVTELVGAIAARCPAPLRCIDLTGAFLGYADGAPGEVLAADAGWRFGIDVAAIDRHAAITAVAYARETSRVVADINRYRDLITRPLRVALRPGWPDTDSDDELRERVRAAGRAGAAAVDFYHVGLATDAELDRIGFAIAGANGPGTR